MKSSLLITVTAALALLLLSATEDLTAQPYTSIGRPGAAVTPPGPGWAPDPSLFIYDGIAAGQMPRIPNIYQVLYNPVIPAPPGPGIMRAGTIWGISMGAMPTRISEIDGYRDVVLASDIHAQHLQIANQEINGTGDIRFSTRETPVTLVPFKEGPEKERMIIKADGNVGINISAPLARFVVADTPFANPGMIIETIDLRASNTTPSFGGYCMASHPGWDYSIGKYTKSASQTYCQIRRQDGLELMTVDNAGHLGVRTIPAAGVNFHVFSGDNPPAVMRLQSAWSGQNRFEFYTNPVGDPNEWRPAYFESMDLGSYTGRLSFYTNGTGSANKTGTKEGLHLANGRVITGPYSAAAWDFLVNQGNAGIIARSTTTPALLGLIPGGSQGHWYIANDTGRFVITEGDHVNGTLAGVESGAALAIEHYTHEVGIGTLDPEELLHVHNGQFKLTKNFMTGSTPEVGEAQFAIAHGGGMFSGHAASSDLVIKTLDGGKGITLATNHADGAIKFTTGLDQKRMTIAANGNIGIGVDVPTYKLEVCGTIRAKEYIGETGWCDFVFEKDYALMPLEQLEEHVSTKKHLPGIPTAAEVEANGVNLADMSSKLLLKVEELTLYVIEQNKQIKALQEECQKLKDQATTR